MAVTLTGTSSGDQGLFNRLGAIGNVLNKANTFRGAYTTGNLPYIAAAAAALFDGANDSIRIAALNLMSDLRNAQSQGGAACALAQAAAVKTLVAMFDADSRLPTANTDYALAALLKQMATATTSKVGANTISATLTQTSCTGTGTVVCGTKSPYGQILENILAETILLTVDSSGRVVASGASKVADKLSYLWPAGSGGVIQLTPIESATCGFITNGDFETFTVANTPDGWTLGTNNTPGTTIYSSTSPVFCGSKCLKFQGTGTQVFHITRTLDAVPSVHKVYALNCWVRVPAGVVGPNSLVININDSSGSPTVTDEAGNAASKTLDLTTLVADTWTPVNMLFAPKEPARSAVQIDIYHSAALDSGVPFYIDEISIGLATQLDSSNPGGTPFLAAFQGGADFVEHDGGPGTVFKMVIANNRSGLWQLLFDKLFDMSSKGLILPTSGTTTISEGLIA